MFDLFGSSVRHARRPDAWYPLEAFRAACECEAIHLEQIMNSNEIPRAFGGWGGEALQPNRCGGL